MAIGTGIERSEITTGVSCVAVTRPPGLRAKERIEGNSFFIPMKIQYFAVQNYC
jgi:hypothetical protein